MRDKACIGWGGGGRVSTQAKGRAAMSRGSSGHSISEEQKGS